MPIPWRDADHLKKGTADLDPRQLGESKSALRRRVLSIQCRSKLDAGEVAGITRTSMAVRARGVHREFRLRRAWRHHAGPARLILPSEFDQSALALVLDDLWRQLQHAAHVQDHRLTAASPKRANPFAPNPRFDATARCARQFR